MPAPRFSPLMAIKGVGDSCIEKALRRAAHVGVLTLWTHFASSELNSSRYV